MDKVVRYSRFIYMPIIWILVILGINASTVKLTYIFIGIASIIGVGLILCFKILDLYIKRGDRGTEYQDK